MKVSSITKIMQAIAYGCTHIGESLSWVRRGGLLKDREVIRQSYWILGALPRKSIVDIAPETRTAEVVIPRAFDRTFRTSITITEATALAALTRARNVKKILEIGTFDGNTALLFACNSTPDGTVVTVDLPQDFDPVKNQASLAHASVHVNVTPREMLAIQYQNAEVASRIKQVYGDSATLDWGTFGGPFDLIFIDGCHHEAYVRSDSLNALKHVAKGGIIVWHDYAEIPDVSTVVDEIMQTNPDVQAFLIEGTRLAIAVNAQ